MRLLLIPLIAIYAPLIAADLTKDEIIREIKSSVNGKPCTFDIRKRRIEFRNMYANLSNSSFTNTPYPPTMGMAISIVRTMDGEPSQEISMWPLLGESDARWHKCQLEVTDTQVWALVSHGPLNQFSLHQLNKNAAGLPLLNHYDSAEHAQFIKSGQWKPWEVQYLSPPYIYLTPYMGFGGTTMSIKDGNVIFDGCNNPMTQAPISFNYNIAAKEWGGPTVEKAKTVANQSGSARPSSATWVENTPANTVSVQSPTLPPESTSPTRIWILIGTALVLLVAAIGFSVRRRPSA